MTEQSAPPGTAVPGFERMFDHGSALYHAGRFAEAETLFDALHSRAPDHLATTLRCAELKLLRGAYREAWPLYERRIMMPVILQEIAFVIGLNRPGWNGRPMPDGTLLVFGEQGNGDNLMALRFLTPVARMVGRVLVFTRHPGLCPLIASVLPGATILTPQDGLGAHRFDAFVMSMSLPAFLRTTPETIPPPPYIQADPARVGQWRRRLSGEGPAVGVCWQGNRENAIDTIRSIPLERLLPALRRPGLRLVSLARDGAGEQLAGIPADERPLDIAAQLTDWGETAAVIAALDLVVTVDTGIAHLAGAMGKETILISRFPPYWPWGASGERTPWYPAMRLVRATAPGRWDEALAETAQLMAQRFG